jgi:hypothetical protein
MAKFALRLLLPVLAAAAVLLVVALLGRWARDSLRGDYTLPFAAIECTPPPGPEQAGLLGEVQYFARLPDNVPFLEDDLAGRLRHAFEHHPWVESVGGVSIGRRRITVQLSYRKPVLAVETAGQMRAVDRNGILLPGTASTAGLPVFSGTASPPAGPAGSVWGDPDVAAAARAASR